MIKQTGRLVGACRFVLAGDGLTLTLIALMILFLQRIKSNWFSRNLVELHINQIVQKAQQQYLFPITQSVATLPIEELALLAESMINITSLRRKVALDNNIGTVGGPIDVAIISKCDGFIWLKRKHYFDRAYNPQYFYSHYMLSESEDINNGE